MDIEEAIQEFLAAQKHLGTLTVVGYEQKLMVFSAWIQEANLKKAKDKRETIKLETITVSVVNSFVEHLKATHTSHKAGATSVATQTLIGYVRVLKTFLFWCLDDEEYSQCVKASTVRRIKLPRREQKIIEVFSDEQIAAMRLACRKEHGDQLRLRDECILAVLAGTGIRAFELGQLKIENIHLHLHPRESYIKVFGKGSKWREVPLNDKTRRQLKIYVQRYRNVTNVTATLFVGRTGKPLTVDGLEKLIRRLGAWANVTGVRCSPHTFRHWFATNWIKTIGDVYLLSKTLGHSSVSVTEEYLKTISGTEVREAILRKLNEL